MEKMKLKITKVDDAKTSTGKDVWHAYAEGHQGYISCWTPRIKDYIGKEQEFDVDKKEMQGQNGAWFAYTIKLAGEQGSGGGRGFFTGGGGGKSYGDPILTAKSMLMSYAKDIVVALIAAGIYKDTKTDMAGLLDFYDAMAKKIIPVQAPPAPAPEQKTADTLSQAKQTIILQKMKIKNFRAKDLIDFAGVQGLEIKYDAEHDTALIGQLGEQEGAYLITCLQDSLK
jgi:hypothetical protein